MSRDLKTLCDAFGVSSPKSIAACNIAAGFNTNAPGNIGGATVTAITGIGLYNMENMQDIWTGYDNTNVYSYPIVTTSGDRMYLPRLFQNVSWYYSFENTVPDIVNYGITSNGAWRIYLPQLTEANIMTFHMTYADLFNTAAANYGTTISQEIEIYPTCFLADTKIRLIDSSLINIQDLKPGMQVLSYDFKSRFWVPGVVTKALVHKYKSGYLLINKTLKVTQGHRLWVNDILSTAGKIKVGDYLRNELYEKAYVFSIERYPYVGDVFNIKVEEHENYIAEGLLVHNKCPFLYSICDKQERYEATVLVGIDKKEKQVKLEYPLKYFTNYFVLRELEPEISYINQVELLYLLDGVEYRLLPEEATSFRLLQGESKYFIFPKLPDKATNLKFAIEGYYTYI